jgi:chromosome segregation ATPase
MKAIKRELLRTSQSLKRKVGKSEKIVDTDYEHLRGDCENLERCLTRLTTHVAQLEDSHRLMSSSMKLVQRDLEDYSRILTESIQHNNVKLVQDNWQSEVHPQNDQALIHLRAITDQLDQLVIVPLQNSITLHVTTPVSDFIAPMKQLPELHKQYTNAELELDYYREKVAYFDMASHQKDPEKLPQLTNKMDQKQKHYQEIGDANKSLMKQTLRNSYPLYQSITAHLHGVLVDYAQNVSRIMNPGGHNGFGQDGLSVSPDHARVRSSGTMSETQYNINLEATPTTGVKLKVNMDI